MLGDVTELCPATVPYYCILCFLNQFLMLTVQTVHWEQIDIAIFQNTLFYNWYHKFPLLQSHCINPH